MTQPTTSPTCPKCASPMGAYERNNVTIDQCEGCRGIFLGCGELERLIDAESNYYQSPRARPRDTFPAASRGSHHGEVKRGGYEKRRRGGFWASCSTEAS